MYHPLSLVQESVSQRKVRQGKTFSQFKVEAVEHTMDISNRCNIPHGKPAGEFPKNDVAYYNFIAFETVSLGIHADTL